MMTCRVRLCRMACRFEFLPFCCLFVCFGVWCLVSGSLSVLPGLMFLFIWNCQGAGSRDFLRAAHFYITTHNPMIMALLETKLSGARANEVCKKLKFSNWIRVEAVGYSGGIWIMWKEEVDVTVRCTHPQFVVLDIKEVEYS